MRKFHGDTLSVEGTTSIEAFSDGVIAIVATLLIIEIKVPHIPGSGTFLEILHAVEPTLRHLAIFAFSFLIICIFWVNHHHFFHQLKRSDWPLLWHNNLLLFWLSVIPFTTAFLGEYPGSPFAMCVYAFAMCMGALSFRLMGNHAYFHGNLTHAHITDAGKRRAYNRTLPAIFLYALAAGVGFYSVWVSWFILLVVPCLYFVPRLSEEYVHPGTAE